MTRRDPIHTAVDDAMQDAWNDICADTGCHPLDIERNGRNLTFEPRHWASAVARRLVAAAPGYIVGDGSGTRFRVWGEMGPDWTTDRTKALRFARREDAEAFAADDIDGWAILPVTTGSVGENAPETKES
jgi:hypothetical protein